MAKFFRIAVLSLILLAVISSHAGAQTIAAIDNKLAGYLKKVTYWSEYDYKDNTVDIGDSLETVNDALERYLMKVCVAVPATISKPFPKAENNGLKVVVSDDHKLKLYSWDTRMGGTMRYYNDIAQYASGQVLKVALMKDTSQEGDYGSDYSSITTIHTNSNKTVYLVQDYSIISTKDRDESITAYVIEGGMLKKTNIFKTKTKSLNTIGCGYDMFSSMDKYPGKDIAGIHLGQDNKKLFIPIVSGPLHEDLTDRYLVYIFDGEHFVFDKNAR